MGSDIFTHKGKQIRTIVGSRKADEYFSKFSFEELTKVGVVPPAYENRPDLIANLFFQDPYTLWYVCFISSKYDVFEDFFTGSTIRVPK